MKLSTLLPQLILNYMCCMVFGVHHNSNHNNRAVLDHNKQVYVKHRSNLWYIEDYDDGNSRTKHRSRVKKHQPVFHNYQRYRPELNDTFVPQIFANREGAHQPSLPPYYLSYDSGQKHRYEPIEDKLFVKQQMNSNFQSISDLTSREQHFNQYNNIDLNSVSKSSPVESQIGVTDDSVVDMKNGLKQTQTSTPIPKPQTISIYSNEINVDQYNYYHYNNGRRVGPKGMGGTFGFIEHNHFYECDKPSHLEPDPSNSDIYRIPQYIDYYYKCMYFDDDPRTDKSRPVGSLGMDGYFGYYENGKYFQCLPPTKLLPDKDNPGLYYIPINIYYDKRCLYFGFNVSQTFDYNKGHNGVYASKINLDLSNLIVTILPIYIYGFN